MNFDQLVEEVYNLTSRPDLITETGAAVRAATLKLHMTDFYAKDIYETVVGVTTPAYVISYDYASDISNLRNLKYIRKLDTDLNPGAFIDVVPTELLLDSYGKERVDVAYKAGRIIEIKSSTLLSKFILGCYVLPPVTVGNYSSWIAENYPYAIAFEAARVIFKTVGRDQAAAEYRQLVAEQVQLMRASELPDVGY